MGETGHVYSYRTREDFAQVADKNIQGFGLQNVTLKCKDVSEGLMKRRWI
jgi:tRNA (adenine57-N1/adenine58-N1)-methyltransferase